MTPQWQVTTDNGETSLRNDKLADGWEPFAVVVHPECASYAEWTEIWFRRLVDAADREEQSRGR